MLVLGIETTCDETAVALVREGKDILSNIVLSQEEIHRPYGGVFPELASRQHVEVLIPVLERALKEAGVEPADVDLIAVARGPGLIGSLLAGLSAAKALSMSWKKPFVGVNHVEAHIYAAMMGQEKPLLPALGVVVSGGHTFLVHILELGSYRLIGTTVDDAVGEAFDKVAAMLSLPYPGGPEIEKLAEQGNPLRYPFKPARVKRDRWAFSFSGLKTSVLYALREEPAALPADIAASFQHAALRSVVEKCAWASREFPCRAIYVGGGVSSNRVFRRMLEEAHPALPIFWPASGLSVDNGAMIAALGYHVYRRQGQGDCLDLEPLTRIPLESIEINF